MAHIFYAFPPTPPPPTPNLWPGVTMTWTGTDGTVWPLTDCASGVQMLAGVRGMDRFRPARQTSESAGVHGSRVRGIRFGEREVFWPTKVYHGDGSQAWLEYDAAWWDSLNPRGTGTWRVTQPSGDWRELTCRPLDAGDPAWADSPGMRNWQHYGTYLVAEDPFWYGPAITSPLWKAPAPVPFIDPVDLAPPFHPGSSTTSDSATLTNPGDEAAWPTWTAVGPLDSVSITLAGRAVSYGALLSGQTLIIDTDPRVQMARRNGVDVTGSLISYDFAPIPAKATVAVTVALVGAGTLQASFRPRFDRAW